MRNYRVQQPCSSYQADGALGFLRTQVTEIADSGGLKTLGEIRSELRKKKNANE